MEVNILNIISGFSKIASLIFSAAFENNEASFVVDRNIRSAGLGVKALGLFTIDATSDFSVKVVIQVAVFAPSLLNLTVLSFLQKLH